MKRLISLVAALLIGCVCLMAQNVYIDTEGIKSSLNQKIDLKKFTFNLDFGVGNAVEAGIHTQLNFNNYVSWDILSLRYSWLFLDQRSHQFFAMTGVRGYTPAFGRSKQMKVYLAVDLGYGGYDEEHRGYYYNKRYWNNDFAVGAELGIYLSKHFYLGISGTITTTDIDFTPAVLRLGFEF